MRDEGLLGRRRGHYAIKITATVAPRPGGDPGQSLASIRPGTVERGKS